MSRPSVAYDVDYYLLVDGERLKVDEWMDEDGNSVADPYHARAARGRTAEGEDWYVELPHDTVLQPIMMQ